MKHGKNYLESKKLIDSLLCDSVGQLLIQVPEEVFPSHIQSLIRDFNDLLD